jgi:hypothetical protein
MCIVIAVLSTTVYTPLIFLGAGLCAGLAAMLGPRATSKV